jgi:hypothetical protein
MSTRLILENKVGNIMQAPERMTRTIRSCPVAEEELTQQGPKTLPASHSSVV